MKDPELLKSLDIFLDGDLFLPGWQILWIVQHGCHSWCERTWINLYEGIYKSQIIRLRQGSFLHIGIAGYSLSLVQETL